MLGHTACPVITGQFLKTHSGRYPTRTLDLTLPATCKGHDVVPISVIMELGTERSNIRLNLTDLPIFNRF